MPKALNLPTVLANAGLTVETIPGWEDRGRPAPDGNPVGLLDIRAIVCHHTAGPLGTDRASLHTVTQGRPDLTGPLAQLFLTRAGVWIVVAAGKSNSNGPVTTEDFANAHTINIEAEAQGTGSPQDWPAEQYQSYAKGVAALAIGFTLPVTRVVGHKEVAVPKGRKTDPSFDMPMFRTVVSRYMSQLIPKSGRDNPRPAIHAPAFKISRVLTLQKPGHFMRGEDVADVQAALARAGYAPKNSKGKDGKWDGVFGPGMDAAVREYQKAKHLTVDGDVWKQTARALGGEVIG